MVKVSVVVVSYNTKPQLERCLTALFTQDPARLGEVIVVDNASSDGSATLVASRFPRARLIALAENAGFSRANNAGLAAALHPFVLFLNSDAYAEPGALDKLAEALDSEDVIAVGGRLLNLDGSLQQSIAGPLTLGAVFLEQTGLEFGARAIGRGYWRTPTGEAAVPVHQLMGACLMIKASCGETWSPDFFLYGEDTEFCRRLSAHGRLLYVPGARFVHELGSSSTDCRWLSVCRYNLGKELFFALVSGPGAAATCRKLNRLGAWLRYLGGTLLAPLGRRWQDKRAAFKQVLDAAPEHVLPPEFAEAYRRATQTQPSPNSSGRS